MAQIHYDYDTDVIPKNFAEEGDPSSGSSIKTKQKGSRTRGGHIPPSKRQRAEEDDQLHENGEKEEKAQINANSRSTEQISRGLSSERLAKLQALKQRMVHIHSGSFVSSCSFISLCFFTSFLPNIKSEVSKVLKTSLGRSPACVR